MPHLVYLHNYTQIYDKSIIAIILYRHNNIVWTLLAINKLSHHQNLYTLSTLRCTHNYYYTCKAIQYLLLHAEVITRHMHTKFLWCLLSIGSSCQWYQLTVEQAWKSWHWSRMPISTKGGDIQRYSNKDAGKIIKLPKMVNHPSPPPPPQIRALTINIHYK